MSEVSYVDPLPPIPSQKSLPLYGATAAGYVSLGQGIANYHWYGCGRVAVGRGMEAVMTIKKENSKERLKKEKGEEIKRKMQMNVKPAREYC